MRRYATDQRYIDQTDKAYSRRVGVALAFALAFGVSTIITHLEGGRGWPLYMIAGLWTVMLVRALFLRWRVMKKARALLGVPFVGVGRDGVMLGEDEYAWANITEVQIIDTRDGDRMERALLDKGWLRTPLVTIMLTLDKGSALLTVDRFTQHTLNQMLADLRSAAIKAGVRVTTATTALEIRQREKTTGS